MTRVYNKSPTIFIINFKLMLQISIIFFSFDSILYREFQFDFFFKFFISMKYMEISNFR